MLHSPCINIYDPYLTFHLAYLIPNHIHISSYITHYFLYGGDFILDEELIDAIKRYHKLMEYRKKIDDELKRLKTLLLDSLPPKFKAEVDGYSISISTYKTTKLDTDAVKLYLGDKINNFQKEVTYTRLTIKKIKR